MNLAALIVIATAFWGHTPACGDVGISAEDLPRSAEALPRKVIGLADTETCVITLDRSTLSESGQACMVTLHELGHLLLYVNPVGYRWPDGTVDHMHSPNPDSIMYPVMRKPRWPCVW